MLVSGLDGVALALEVYRLHVRAATGGELTFTSAIRLSKGNTKTCTAHSPTTIHLSS